MVFFNLLIKAPVFLLSSLPDESCMVNVTVGALEKTLKSVWLIVINFIMIQAKRIRAMLASNLARDNLIVME
jgi:hypothetical protein